MANYTLNGPRYWALGALSALYAFLAESRAITFAPMSQKIVYQAPEGGQNQGIKKVTTEVHRFLRRYHVH
jgi:hypothetical protein